MGGIIYYKPPSDNPYENLWYPDSSGIKGFAEDQIEKAVVARDNVLDDLYAKLSELNGDLEGVLNIPLLSAELSNLSISIPDAIDKPTAPIRPDIPNDYPTVPEPAVLGSVADLVLDNVPILVAEKPTLRDIAAPGAFTKTAPVAEALPTRYFPDKPGYTMPDAPTVRELVLPTAPSMITVNFEGVLPEALPTPPDINFSFTEQEYQSILNGTLKSKLYDLVLNTRQTGLNPTIEAQIWSRARERTSAVARQRKASVRRQFSALGWNIPPGDEAMMIMQADEQAAGDDITESRNIAIEQAKLEQANFQFSFTQAIALESQLMNLHNSVQQRAFESAKYEVEALISLYQIQVSYFNANVTLYTAQSAVYRDRIQAELAKIELYKGQLEGQKLISELNAQDIANYKARIDAVVAVFELYKSELEAVKIQLSGDELKIRQFEANIKAFGEEIKAKSLEYEGYKAQLSGEEIKTNVYNALVNAFGKEVDAFVGMTDAKVKKLDADIKVNFDVPLKVLDQRTAAYKAQVEAKTSQIAGITKIYEVDGSVYEAEAKATAQLVGVDIERAKLDLELVSKQVATQIDVFKANIAVLLSQKELLIAARKSETQLKAQIAASIGGSVNFGASISGSSAYANGAPGIITY